MKIRKIPYPRYKREEKLNIKFKTKDIEEARRMRNTGLSFRKIGKIFNVSPFTIFYNLKNEKERKEINKKKKRIHKPYKKEDAIKYKRFRERKKKLRPNFLLWYNQRKRESYSRKIKILTKGNKHEKEIL